MKSSLPLLLAVACMATSVQAQFFGDEMINELDGFDDSRQISVNNDSSIIGVIAIAGMFVIVLAVGLYLYDYATSRSDNSQNTYYVNPPYGQNGYGYNRYKR